MNILVVEDIEVQRRALIKMIKTNFNMINIYEAENTTTAINIIEDKKIDLFILDINLNGESGMDLAKKIREYSKYKLTGIIFITSENTYFMSALKEAHCYDYITKPYDENQIKEIVKIFLNENIDDTKESEYTMFDLGNEFMVKIYNKDIIFIEYYLRRCKIYTKKKVYSVKGKSLSNLINEINYKPLVQSHKSYVINVNHIESVEKYYEKLWTINFYDYNEKAKLGYKYKKAVISCVGNK